MPLPLSTTSAATRESTAKKFLLLPLFLPRLPVVPRLLLLPQLLDPLPGLVHPSSSGEVAERGGVDRLTCRPCQNGQGEGRQVVP